ncbi:MAG TPA: carboxymuconolactone decarboxylase family protein [Acetobacteraceae bacterium]|jgi:4-carboxymuconolactone decarboxylase|nr:carboxymuconolactone decarboxylase family protein [Acetobacteraceae bacterium]
MSTTERFPPLPPEALTPEQRAVAQAILSGPRGQIQGPFNVLLRAPGVADPVQRLGAHLRFAGSLDPALREIAILTVARHWAAQFEWFAHHPIAASAGVSLEALERLRLGRDPEFADQGQQLAWRASVRVLRDGRLDDGLFAEARTSLGEEALVELLVVLGYYTLLSFILNVGRVAVPHPPFEEPG